LDVGGETSRRGEAYIARFAAGGSLGPLSARWL
jgi:hypothetical protein